MSARSGPVKKFVVTGSEVSRKVAGARTEGAEPLNVMRLVERRFNDRFLAEFPAAFGGPPHTVTTDLAKSTDTLPLLHFPSSGAKSTTERLSSVFK